MKYKLSKLAGKMKEEGYTQRDVSNSLKRSGEYVGKRLRGQGYFNMREIYSICDLLHIPYSEILDYFPKFQI